MNKNNLLTCLVLALVVGPVGFWGGAQYQKSQQPNLGANTDRLRGDRVGQGMMQPRSNLTQGFRPVTGEIVGVDENSITVKLEDGSSKLVVLADSTLIRKSQTAFKDDLQTGVTVMVMGSQNTDGSINAQTISLGETGLGNRSGGFPPENSMEEITPANQ